MAARGFADNPCSTMLSAIVQMTTATIVSLPLAGDLTRSSVCGGSSNQRGVVKNWMEYPVALSSATLRLEAFRFCCSFAGFKNALNV